MLEQQKSSRYSGLGIIGLSLFGLVGCLSEGGREPVVQGAADYAPVLSKTVLGQCALESPLRELGNVGDKAGDAHIQSLLQAPPAVPREPTATLNTGSCADNTQFRIGTGVQDMTGPAVDSISTGYEDPSHVLRGIHLRQFARAFAVESPCNGQRVVMAISESGFLPQGVRQSVIDMIAADPELGPLYPPEAVMLSSTHTHSGPGGDAHHTAYNVFRLGYDALVHEVYSTAIFRAIQQAHRNLAAHPEPGSVQLALGELLNANTNRSEPAYANNPEAERAGWQDVSGQEVRVNKQMTQLRFDRANGRALGLLNWFGVHTTSVGTAQPLISSDNKGLAALTMERMMGTDYTAPDGEDRFVAAFAQADEGDASPNLCFREYPFPDVRIGCGENTLQSNAAHGVKQLARAIELYDGDSLSLRGGVSSRLMHVRMDAVEITDPVILASLQHPEELDEPVKRTCTAALGYSMAAGAEDQRGPSQEGIHCGNIDAVGVASADIQLVIDGIAANASASGYPTIPASTFGTVVGCGLTGALGTVPGLPDADYSCQAEKPILFPIGTSEFVSNADLPFQIVTIGQLAIIALPWEVTTTSARRIRDVVLTELRGGGIEYAVVAALSNDFVQYLTTREEYATQEYEAASTHFGPWTLAAVQQELRQLAISLREGLPAPTGVPAPRSEPALPTRGVYRPGDARPAQGDYGDVLVDAAETYQSGDTVTLRFASAHPRNDTLETLNGAYVEAQKQRRDGSWETVARERDPEIIAHWFMNPESPVQGQSFPYRQAELEAIWHLPANLPQGKYRVIHNGTAVPSFDNADAGDTIPFQGSSRVFEVQASGAKCPGYPALF